MPILDQFFLLAGPCAIEGETMAMRIAERVCEITINLKYHIYLKEVLKKLIEAESIVLQELVMKKHLKF